MSTVREFGHMNGMCSTFSMEGGILLATHVLGKEISLNGGKVPRK